MELTEEQTALRKQRWAVVQEHIRCERLGTDIDGAVAAFRDGHATYDVVPLRHTRPEGAGLTHPRPEDVHELLSNLTTAFPDLELIPERVHHSDDAIVVEGRTTGTHRAEFMGIPATGRTIDVAAAVIYRFDGEHMTNETLYFDLATQMRQLGFESMPL